ncbi:hypothetical protein CJ030_MR4G020424 [Morella rubra]|uniref:Uncharacterized protein n=1 Tax=Morella rubra TaxID=262757 RepID=A0A6A1VUM2_9ROSI|nr:hypothetical protein CJ030_MR4G020424 [Morella rubra]
MGYRRTSRNTWVPKRQGSDEDEDVDEDVAEAEDEAEVRERMTAMHEAQKKFLQGECYFYARGAEAVLLEMRTFMARFPPP